MNRLKRAWWAFWGWVDCPVCHQQIMRWEKDYVFHPEEPPCFGHWQCFNPECRVSSDITATWLMDEAAQKHGFKNFDDFMEKKDGV